MRGKVAGSYDTPYDRWDHPRLCGEKNHDHGRHRYQAGSPPPMRGKAENACVTDAGNRITPAYAGKSCTTAGCNIYYQDHPRLCGEKTWLLISLCRLIGSPPPMRGKAGRCAASVPNWRITPAYAGKRNLRSNHRCVLVDHPRLCGEKPCGEDAVSGLYGSPPPMRGKEFVHLFS